MKRGNIYYLFVCLFNLFLIKDIYFFKPKAGTVLKIYSNHSIN